MALLASTTLTGLGQVASDINRSVWKQKYGVLDSQINDPAWLSQDADSDGVDNRGELAAGTNPFGKRPGEPHFRSPGVRNQEASLSLEFPTVPGKFYQVETSDELADWIAGSLPNAVGDGSAKSLAVPKSSGKFFRLRVSDTTSHGDQISDWAKLQLGYSLSAPLSQQTSYQAAGLAASLEEQNEVTLAVVIDSATQPTGPGMTGDAAVVRVSRSGSIVPGAVTVPLSVTGTAVPGTDYTALPSAVTFPPGVNAVDLKISPLPNLSRTTPATVVVKVGGAGTAGASGNFRVGSPSSAGVTVHPSGVADGTGLTARYFPGSSSTYTSVLNFSNHLGATYAYTRTNSTTGSMVVTYYGTPNTPYVAGSTVKLQFTSGNLNNATYNDKTYTITAVAPNTFTAAVTGTSLPSTGTGNSIIKDFREPVDGRTPTISFNWGHGSPNATNLVGSDNYSVVWTGFLSPTTAGSYTFRLDADDKAKVSIDLNDGGGFRTLVQNGWDDPATGTYKLSEPVTLEAAPVTRYPVKVEFVETTGLAKLKFHWQLGTGTFALVPSTQVFTAATGGAAGWSGVFYNNPTFTPPAASTPQTTTDFTTGSNGDWLTGSPDPLIFHNNFSARWSGQVLPRYSQRYYFVSKANEGSKVWVNDQLIIDKWTGSSGTDATGSIELKGGVRYNIVMEYYETTGASEASLSWYSADQAKQIIPANRLIPAPLPGAGQGASPAPGAAPEITPELAGPVITSPTSAVAVMDSGSPFSMNVTSSNSGVITAEGLPDWLTLVNGVLGGTPTAPGIYQFTLTTTNELGASSVIMTIEVLAVEGKLTRETWTTGVAGPLLSDVPWHAAPSGTGTVTGAEAVGGTPGANTGQRLRGYITVPATGNYYFWIAASNAAELWISNDGEPVNKVLRAKVTGPAGTAAREWDAQPGQKSPWLSLNAGTRYYIEVLNNTGAAGTSSHLSVGWFADPTGTTENPITNGAGVVPGHLFSEWDNPPTTTVPGALYVANLQGVEGLGNIAASGGSFLRVNGSEAVMQLHHSGLTSGVVSRRVHNARGEVVFDIGAQEKNFPESKTSDGGYRVPLSGTSLTDLNNGGLYLKIATVNHPDGEIAGIYGKVAGSQAAPAPPAYPAWPQVHASDDGANSRFLTQASFGPTPSDMAYVKANGYRAWIDSQFTIPSTKNLAYVVENLSNDPQNPYTNTLIYNSWWKNSVTAPDQLRQRTAFALSQILVVSSTGPLNNNARGMAVYYDTLLDNSFGNFRDILRNVTLSPAMGAYLDMRGNSLGNMANGTHPNENYAREILQLFSVGLYRLWPDGTVVLDSKGLAVPTYDQKVITGFARVFTGWNWGQALQGTGRLPTSFSPSSNYFDPMVLVPARHELGSKILLDNVVIPPAVVTTAADTSTDSDSTLTVQSVDPARGQGNVVTTLITNRYDLNGLRDLEQSLDNIMNNPALGPYICRQLIQRLVTSHPEPAYVHRVVRAFNGERNVDGVATGVRGDMKEVLRAVLLDYEARSSDAAARPGFGKQREPVLRVTGLARTFPAASFPGSTYRQIGLHQILVTTPEPHRLINSEVVRLADFDDDGDSTVNRPPVTGYTISNVTVSYSLAGSTGVATITSPGFKVGDTVSIQFVAGTLGSNATFKQLRDYTVVSATPTNFTIDIGNKTFSNINATSNGALLARNFTVNTLNYLSGTYTSTGSSVVVTASGFVTGQKAFVRFSTGGLAGGTLDGEYTVTEATSSNFTITLGSSPANTTGTALVPRFAGGYNVSVTAGSSNIDIYTTGAHHLSVGDEVFVNFLVTNKSGTNGPAPNGTYTVSEIRTPNVFRVTVGTPYNTGSQSSGGMLAYPLEIPVWERSGTTTVELATWNIGSTGGDLGQTPLNAPTVFNFYYPDYRFPGPTAQAGMTTPEFQLTNVSGTMSLTNTVTTSILSATNPNGYSSFKNSGAIMSDLSPFMTPEQTANDAIPDLVDTLSLRMIGRELESAQRTIISDFALTQTLSNPPTNTQMRDRVRAIVHLIATSAEYAIQK